MAPAIQSHQNYIQVIKADRWTNDGTPGSGMNTQFEQDPLGGQVLYKSHKFHNVWEDLDGNYLDSAEAMLAADAAGKQVYQDGRAILPTDIPVIERLMDQVISQLDIGDTDRETDSNEDGILTITHGG
ncbi:MAG: hypothetical protein ACLSAP_06045 [Oscillospiraceae bacterium]